MRFIDTSIFLCVMIGEPKANFAGCKALLQKIASGKESAATTFFNILEIVFVLEREGVEKKTIVEKVKAILDMAGLSVYGGLTNPDDVLAVYLGKDIDLVDALDVAAMQAHNIREIYSLDSHYDRIKEIKRVIP